MLKEQGADWTQVPLDRLQWRALLYKISTVFGFTESDELLDVVFIA
jgi:hypothetical protein